MLVSVDLPNAHETKSVTIPGATQLEVTFDPRCVSEQNYDQLFFTDETYSNKLQTYTGPTSRWPKEPVIVDGDTLHTLFTSDGSGQMVRSLPVAATPTLVFRPECALTSLLRSCDDGFSGATDWRSGPLAPSRAKEAAAI